LSYACDHVTFTYDDDGNVTAKITPDGTTQYRWDSENRLIGITKPDGTAIAYQYDELGRRVAKTVTGPSGSSQSRWTYLGEDIHRMGGAGAPTYVYGPGIDEPLGFGGYEYFIADGLGSIRQIVDAGGNVLNQYRYTAFGKMKQVQAAVGNTYTYTGREWDADAGLYYYRARWYDPDVGRFLAKDPIGFAGGDVVLYGYCMNDPINGIDPNGLDVKVDILTTESIQPAATKVLDKLEKEQWISPNTEGALEAIAGKFDACIHYNLFKSDVVNADFLLRGKPTKEGGEVTLQFTIHFR
jgi:RHS repeat-associated protein